MATDKDERFLGAYRCHGIRLSKEYRYSGQASHIGIAFLCHILVIFLKIIYI